MGWGDAWAGLSQQAFAATINSLEEREQRKYQDKRDQIARKAAEAQEKSRRAYEERMQSQRVVQTYTDPNTGQIIPVTEGQIRSGQAAVPQSVLQAQRAEAELASRIAAEDRALKSRRTEAQIRADEARAQASAASAGLSRARMENPEKFRMGRSDGGQRASPEVAAARGMYNTLVNKSGDSEKALAQVRALYGEDVVSQAFPGQAEQRNRAAQTVGRVVTGVEDLLNKYLNQ
jgi:hypothetical protein